MSSNQIPYPIYESGSLWWVASPLDQEPEGPFDIGKIFERILSGELSSDTLICRGEGFDWLPACALSRVAWWLQPGLEEVDFTMSCTHHIEEWALDITLPMMSSIDRSTPGRLYVSIPDSVFLVIGPGRDLKIIDPSLSHDDLRKHMLAYLGKVSTIFTDDNTPLRNREYELHADVLNPEAPLSVRFRYTHMDNGQEITGAHAHLAGMGPTNHIFVIARAPTSSWLRVENLIWAIISSIRSAH